MIKPFVAHLAEAIFATAVYLAVNGLCIWLTWPLFVHVFNGAGLPSSVDYFSAVGLSFFLYFVIGGPVAFVVTSFDAAKHF